MPLAQKDPPNLARPQEPEDDWDDIWEDETDWEDDDDWDIEDWDDEEDDWDD